MARRRQARLLTDAHIARDLAHPIEREFDPEAIRRLKAESTRDINIGGAELACEALRARLVDDIHLILSPVIVGGGKRALPADLRLDLDLVSQRRFGNGVVHLHYRTHN